MVYFTWTGSESEHYIFVSATYEQSLINILLYYFANYFKLLNDFVQALVLSIFR